MAQLVTFLHPDCDAIAKQFGLKQWPYCEVCKKPVDSISYEYDIVYGVWDPRPVPVGIILTIACHGESNKTYRKL